ncbi:tetratricopeptide repeat protein [Actinomadura syzygii]|uniref:Tetratricopeptide repeat protein n=1 Tax=Actinomadura syzygii TaxID=1427538 RepID=A0A5D0TX23_9ACTN|nr:tetratricopeptide repeat protein [Actinomadura syzygii]TYC09990.1 tetratricopeptide repeat protein [Actinomadura syzygii]
MRRWLSGGVLVLAVGALVGLTYAEKLPALAGYPLAVVVVGLLGAVLKDVLVDVLKSGSQERRAAGRARREALWTHALHSTPEGGLPKVRDYPDPARLDARGRTGTRAAAYVPRDVDAEVERALHDRRMVLLTGPSAAGKTRAAFEVIRRLDRRGPLRLLVPVRPGSPAELAEAGVRLSDTVIWLDDLETYLGRGGLDRATLDRLANPADGGSRVLVVATMRAQARRALEEAPGSLPPEVRQALNAFVQVRVRPELTAAERANAEGLRGDERIAAALDAAGDRAVRLAEYLAGGPAALDRWQRGRDGEHVRGAAVVSAAVHARAAGHLGAFGEASLRALSELFVPAEDARPGDSDFADALEWATTREDDVAACLNRVDDGLYQPFDYLVDQVQAADEDMPAPVWDAVCDLLAPEDALPFAGAAHRAGRLPVAERALRAALDVRPDRGELLCPLGSLLWDDGRVSEAEPLFRRACDAGDGDGANSLGLLHALRGDTGEAERLYRLGVARGSAEARNNLGMLLTDRDEAEVLFRRAAAEEVAEAMNNLALLLAETNRREEAETWFGNAVAAGLLAATVNLGVLLMEDGRYEEASARFWEAVEGTPAALNNLGVLRAHLGESFWAEEALKPAVAAGLREAARNLDRLRTREGGEPDEIVLCGTAVRAVPGGGRVPIPMPSARAARLDRAAPAPSSSRTESTWERGEIGVFRNLAGDDVRELSWLGPSMFWHRRNEAIAKVFGDPSNGLRRRWVAEQRERGAAPDAMIVHEKEAGGFLLLGSTGGGGAGQYAVVPGLLKTGADTDFMIICGDVLLPAGALHAAGPGFFRPYRGYPAPIYAVPGNHDWYDGLNGFMRIFCGADPLPAAGTPSGLRGLLWRRATVADEDALAAARQLRGASRQRARQPGPYWAIDTPSLRIIGIDTGIGGIIDRDQAEWLRRVSAGDKPKLLVSHHAIYGDDTYRPVRIEGGGTVDEIVRDPARNFVAAVGGSIHNYQRYPVRVGDRTIQYIVSGGGGALTVPTHTIRRTTVVDEEAFRCYPLREDSMAFFSRALPFRRTGGPAIPAAQAGVYLSRRLRTPLRWWSMDAPEPGLGMRLTANMLSRRIAMRYLVDRVPRDRPPLFKSFLRVDVSPDRLRIRCFAATGYREQEINPPLEDEVTIPL